LRQGEDREERAGFGAHEGFHFMRALSNIPEIVGLRPRFPPLQLLRQVLSVVDFSMGVRRQACTPI